jgi:hypothetical protein
VLHPQLDFLPLVEIAAKGERQRPQRQRRLGLRRSQRRKLDVERRETARGATVIERPA